MMWLIGALGGWLLAAFAFAALAGWVWHALRDARREEELETSREQVLTEIVRLCGPRDGDGASARSAAAFELDGLRRRNDLVVARVTELENALAAARRDASEAGQRASVAADALSQARIDGEELARLRAEAGGAGVRASASAPDADIANAQAWRLRYFEQRVRYLEGRVGNEPAQASAPPAPALTAPTEDRAERHYEQWRARTAEARAAFLEEALRARAPAPTQVDVQYAAVAPDPFIAWRMTYLERRAAYMAQAHALAPVSAPDPEAERLKWRARYLESRLRHLDRTASEHASREQALREEARAARAHGEAIGADLATTRSEAQSLLARAEALRIELATAEVARDALRADLERLRAAPPSAPMLAAIMEAPAAAPELEPVRVISAGLERRPPTLPAARGGAPDDLTLIEEISPMQQSTLNSLGVYHFDQIASWRAEHVAWVDQYLRLRGRIVEEQWVEQAEELARNGPLAFKGAFEDETV